MNQLRPHEDYETFEKNNQELEDDIYSKKNIMEVLR